MPNEHEIKSEKILVKDIFITLKQARAAIFSSPTSTSPGSIVCAAVTGKIDARHWQQTAVKELLKAKRPILPF